MPKLDSAIVQALKLDPSKTTVASHGGSGFASTHKVTSGDQLYFVKQGTGSDAEVMFAGEHESLNAINSAVPSLCPRSFAHGPLSDSPGFFLATEFLNLTAASPSPSSQTLAYKLSQLHKKAASPDGNYGFPVPTCCGSTVQDNTYESTWADFFCNRRLLTILSPIENKHGSQQSLQSLIQKTTSKTGAAHILLSRLSSRDPNSAKAVVVHGDLWSGNKSVGTIHGRTTSPEAVIYDPSGCYAAAEYDHGIMRMFGGFDGKFWKEYYENVPKGEPVGEYEDRVALYEAYHQLNHYALFGGGYKAAAVEILERLERKYGRK